MNINVPESARDRFWDEARRNVDRLMEEYRSQTVEDLIRSWKMYSEFVSTCLAIKRLGIKTW